jgi:5-methyltetrahydropteroyltriglutamate--homocysteine methyltransferase
MTRTKPPYRADHVGSFLRTAPLKEARAKREKGQITDAQLKAVEDREIEKLIKKQDEVGLKLASDGEFRRSWWHFDFYGLLDGVEIYEFDHGIQFQACRPRRKPHVSRARSAFPTRIPSSSISSSSKRIPRWRRR